jgi:hypothetical protein
MNVNGFFIGGSNSEFKKAWYVLKYGTGNNEEAVGRPQGYGGGAAGQTGRE